MNCNKLNQKEKIDDKKREYASIVNDSFLIVCDDLTMGILYDDPC